MKVTFERTVGPERMLQVMKMTEGSRKGKKKLPKLETFGKMILSEHSPSRVVRYLIKVEGIPFYAHVHLVRHGKFAEFWVMSQRDDGGYQEVTSRDELPQGALVDMYIDANVQTLVTISKFRSCYKAHRIVQNFISQLKMELMHGEYSDKYDNLVGKLLLKRCEWNGGYCQEPKPCGRVVGVRNAMDVHRKVFEDFK